jgi:hypothetical protein
MWAGFYSYEALAAMNETLLIEKAGRNKTMPLL